jgi:hypothetical protein
MSTITAINTSVPREVIESVSPGISKQYTNAIVVYGAGVEIDKAYGMVVGTSMTLKEIQEFVASRLPGTTVISLEAGKYNAVDGLVVRSSESSGSMIDCVGPDSIVFRSTSEAVAKKLIAASKSADLLEGAINSTNRVWRSRCFAKVSENDLIITDAPLFFSDERNISAEEIYRRNSLRRC